MDKKYIISIDQSTQGTKALLFDDKGALLHRSDLPHRQLINQLGWVEHDPMEIYRNTIQTVRNLIQISSIDSKNIVGIGISNQRETALVWDRNTGEPIFNAIVWQCARGEAICNRIDENGKAELIKNKTGLPLSPYFSAAKIAWVIENVKGAKVKSENGELCCGTIDSWLVYKLTRNKEFRTDYSNASRTQLFNITELTWDKEICELFGINKDCLAKICDSDSEFGKTDMEGIFEHEIPIHGVLGDSHGALFGQGCLSEGMIKATYGTGSSIMMNIGSRPVLSKQGLVTSLAWKINGKVNYVLEGNVNYTGAVISWLQNDLKLIASAKETEDLALQANQEDSTYLVPAFTGLGAPYWDSKATAMISGITRTTGQAELVKAALECIAYQITDILQAMNVDSGITIEELRVDGGATKNTYLMQFQSDIADIPVRIPNEEELSGIGAAYAAGLGIGLYKEAIVFNRQERRKFTPIMPSARREEKYTGWKEAIKVVRNKK